MSRGDVQSPSAPRESPVRDWQSAGRGLRGSGAGGANRRRELGGAAARRVAGERGGIGGAVAVVVVDWWVWVWWRCRGGRRGGGVGEWWWDESERVGEGWWVSFLTAASLGRREEESDQRLDLFDLHACGSLSWRHPHSFLLFSFF
jgi:hypothetical protein